MPGWPEFGNRFVESLVGLVKRARVLTIGKKALAGKDFIEPFDILGRCDGRRTLHGCSLERLADHHSLGNQGNRNAGDKCTRLRKDIDSPASTKRINASRTGVRPTPKRSVRTFIEGSSRCHLHRYDGCVQLAVNCGGSGHPPGRCPARSGPCRARTAIDT